MDVILFGLFFSVIPIGIFLVLIYHVTKASSKDALDEYKEEIRLLIKEEIQNAQNKPSN